MYWLQPANPATVNSSLKTAVMPEPVTSRKFMLWRVHSVPAKGVGSPDPPPPNTSAPPSLLVTVSVDPSSDQVAAVSSRVRNRPSVSITSCSQALRVAASWETVSRAPSVL